MDHDPTAPWSWTATGYVQHWTGAGSHQSARAETGLQQEAGTSSRSEERDRDTCPNAAMVEGDVCPAQRSSTRVESTVKFSLKWDICPEAGWDVCPGGGAIEEGDAVWSRAPEDG